MMHCNYTRVFISIQFNVLNLVSVLAVFTVQETKTADETDQVLVVFEQRRWDAFVCEAENKRFKLRLI